MVCGLLSHPDRKYTARSEDAVRGIDPGELAGVDESFGPLKIAINTSSATGEVKATPVAAFLGLMRIMRKVIAARLRGKYKENLFFTPGSGEPIRTPQVLTLAERRSLETAR